MLIVAVMLLTGTTTIAQESELTDEQKAQMQVQFEKHFKILGLSDGQIPKFQEITRKYSKQLMTLRDSDNSRFTKYKTYRSIIKNRNEEMKVVLSEKQFELYQEIQEELQKEMRERNSNKS